MMNIHVDLAKQQLFLFENKNLIQSYAISSGKNGSGEKKNSGQTPKGCHIIRAKIGGGAKINTVFVGRRPTGEVYTPALRVIFPNRDWILTRILWLSGLEIGKNRLGEVDTMQRFIYIHGTPDDNPIGVPLSNGCIRMRNNQVIELFDRVAIGTKLLIS